MNASPLFATLAKAALATGALVSLTVAAALSAHSGPAPHDSVSGQGHSVSIDAIAAYENAALAQL